MTMRERAILWSSLLCCACGACDGPAAPPRPPAPAAEARAAAPLPAEFAFAGRQLPRNGQGLCEWGLLGIDLYRAALYCTAPVRSAEQALAPEQTLVFHLEFVRGLTAAQLRAAFAAAVKANAGNGAADHAAALQALDATMRDVRAGDSYTFGCEPGRGVVVLRNGEELGRIGDEPFRRLFVRLYLGEHPPTTALRDGLLGRSGGGG